MNLAAAGIVTGKGEYRHGWESRRRLTTAACTDSAGSNVRVCDVRTTDDLDGSSQDQRPSKPVVRSDGRTAIRSHAGSILTVRACPTLRHRIEGGDVPAGESWVVNGMKSAPARIENYFHSFSTPKAEVADAVYWSICLLIKGSRVRIPPGSPVTPAHNSALTYTCVSGKAALAVGRGPVEPLTAAHYFPLSSSSKVIHAH